LGFISRRQGDAIKGGRTMMIRAGSWIRNCLPVLFAMAGLAATPSWAQYTPYSLPNMGQTGLPQLPPQGAWGEVIMANAKWLVIQNQQGQQFPIAMQGVTQFLIRWPTNANALTPNSIIEAIGADAGSNMLSTDHVDVYEGAAQTLVTPTLRSLLDNGNRPVTTIDPGYNRSINAFDIGEQNSMYGWAYPVMPGDIGIPARLYAVGSVAGLNPLRLNVPGNNVVTILPPDGGTISFTQVTRGSSSFAQKGDLAFMMPTEVTPKSLILSQLVLYKKIPLSQFAAP